MLFRVLVSRKGLLNIVIGTFSVFMVILSSVQMAYALGVGAVKTESFIGQPFSAWVPLLNVQNAEDLLVEVSASSIVPDADVGSLESQIVELDNQLNIRITSEQVVNEPYLIFSLRLTEAGQVVTRDFTVLLDMQPRQGAFANTLSSSAPIQTDVATPLNNAQVNSGTVAFVDVPEILGPYDYAVKGQVPRRFGAVLDGQSLWRVARRINQALDVSINQMMWALYVHNPDAFANESVDSLRAGQYLTIPTFSEVARVSDAQALTNLDRLSSDQYVSNVEVPAAIETAQSEQVSLEIPSTELLDEPKTIAETAPVRHEEALSLNSDEASFTLSGLDELGEPGSIESDEQSLEVINSLAVSVGNLTQELIRKDKQIEFLEEKILALESIAALDGIPSGGQQIGVAVASNSSQVSNSLSVDPQSNSPRPWLIWVGLLSLALVSMLFLRKRLFNVFSRHEDIEFAQKSNPNPVKNSQTRSFDGESQNYSNLAVVRKTEDDGADGFSYVSVNDTESEFSLDLLESDENSESYITVEEEDFEGYLAGLIESKRFDSALNFLKSQRRNIDEDRYHVERLGVYFEQRKKDAFYTYYDHIEAIMPRFGDASNRRISEMVVALEEQKQNKV